MSRVKFDFSDIEEQNKLRKAISDVLDGIKIDNEIEDWNIKEVKFNKETNGTYILLQVNKK